MPSLLQRLADSLSLPFLVIGGHALQAYGHLRSTLDTDILIASDSIDQVESELLSLGFTKTASNPLVHRYTRPDGGGDCLESLDVLLVNSSTFSQLLGASDRLDLGSDTTCRVPCLPHLIAMKLHAIRQDQQRELQDLADIVALLRLNPAAISSDELRELADRYGPPDVFARITSNLTDPAA